MKKTTVLALILLINALPIAAQGVKRAFAGDVTAVAIDQVSGHIAVTRGDRIEIFATIDAGEPRDAFLAPGPKAAVLAFQSGVLRVFSQAPDHPFGVTSFLTESGRDLLKLPHEETVLLGAGTHLIADGSGIVVQTVVDSQARKELTLPDSVPDGAWIIFIRTFDGRDRMIAFTPDASLPAAAGPAWVPQDVLALGLEDLIVTRANGSVSRFVRGEPAWTRTLGGLAAWKLTDYDAKAGLVLALQPEAGDVHLIDIGTGAVRGTWSGVSSRVEIERFLDKTRGPHARSKHLGALLDLYAEAAVGGSGDGETLRGRALRGLFGIDDARLLGDGDVLVVGTSQPRVGVRRWSGVLRISSGTLTGRELLDSLAVSGGTPVTDQLDSSRAVLSRDLLLVGGRTLLAHGTDGWYLIKL